MSQALYRKWRPNQWDQVVGQEHVIQTLRHAVAAERVAHAYLFAGPRGTGKTTTARLLAKAVNCLTEDLAERPCGKCEHCLAVNQGRFLDLIEIDAASNTSVEDVRDLRDKINFSPNQARYKVYIIDEVHMLSTAAFNALLKTLEEPPGHAIFILATTEVHKIPATVLSRCQRHEFRRIPVTDIVAHLRQMADGESIRISDEALTLVARQSTGALRDAISLLDQLASTGEEISLEMAQDLLGTAASQAVLGVVEALIVRQPEAGLAQIHQSLDAGSDPRQFARQIVEYLRDLLLIRMGSANQVDATAEVRAQMARHAQALDNSNLLRIIRNFNQAAVDTRGSWQPSLPLEMAFVESLEAPDEASSSPSSAPSRSTPGSSAPKNKTPARADTPPAQAAETPDSPESEASGGDRMLQKVNDNWRKIVELVGQRSRQTLGLLNSCKPFGMKDGVLFLGFNGEFAKSKMEKDDSIDHIKITCQALEDVMGSQIPVRCFVATGRGGKLPPDIDSDGMVAAALRDLGGEIVDIQ
jgi:DNA polymerase-3 subunit gamma/tau